jgi:hypothetical protein
MNPLRRITDTLRPWPSKHDRRATVDAAKRRREDAEAEAAEAWQVAQDLRRYTTNHYAQDIAQQILGGHHLNGA